MGRWLDEHAVHGRQALRIDDVASVGKRELECVCTKLTCSPHPLGHCRFCGLRLPKPKEN